MKRERSHKKSAARFEAQIVELGDHDGGRLILTRLSDGEVCLEFHHESTSSGEKRTTDVWFVLLSDMEVSAMREALSALLHARGDLRT